MSNLAIIALTALAAAAPLPDPRDGQVYRTVIFGQARWFAQNLNFDTSANGDLAANCAVHGRLYRWDEADTALERARGDRLGDRLKPGGDTGFDARYSGYSDPHRAGAYVRLGERAVFWTSTDAERNDISALAWHRDISENRSSIWRSKVNQTYRLSVRCIADSRQVVASTGAPSFMRSRLPGSWSMRTTSRLPSNS